MNTAWPSQISVGCKLELFINHEYHGAGKYCQSKARYSYLVSCMSFQSACCSVGEQRAAKFVFLPYCNRWAYILTWIYQVTRVEVKFAHIPNFLTSTGQISDT